MGVIQPRTPKMKRLILFSFFMIATVCAYPNPSSATDDELDFLLNKQLSKEDLQDLLFLLKSNVADDRLSQAPVRRFHNRYYNNLDHLARMNFKRSDPALLQSLKQQQMSNFRRQQRFSNL